VDLIAHLRRDTDGRRRLQEIAEVTPGGAAGEVWRG
jgi:hypothetical protein